MKKVAHIINPCIVPETSDLFVAQPVTFESILRAYKYAEDSVRVKLLTAQFREDNGYIPKIFEPTPDLDRSILDVSNFESNRKLPLLRDILDRLYKHSDDSDYLIYTNSDIALKQEFYIEINHLINKGYDAFAITRRTISKKFTQPSEIEFMYAEEGQSHPGHDCFIFAKHLYPKFYLVDVCVGSAWFDKMLLWNLVLHASNFAAFTDLQLTFHLGDDKRWKKSDSREFSLHNKSQISEMLETIERDHGSAYKHDKLWPHVQHVYEKLDFRKPNFDISKLFERFFKKANSQKK